MQSAIQNVPDLRKKSKRCTTSMLNTRIFCKLQFIFYFDLFFSFQYCNKINTETNSSDELSCFPQSDHEDILHTITSSICYLNVKFNDERKYILDKSCNEIFKFSDNYQKNCWIFQGSYSTRYFRYKSTTL